MKAVTILLLLASIATVWSAAFEDREKYVAIERRGGLAAFDAEIPARQRPVALESQDRAVERLERRGGIAALNAAVSAGELALKIQDRAVEVFNTLHGAKELHERTRSLELVVANGSPRTLKFAGEYFDSGTWYSQPAILIQPNDATVATVANRQGSWFTGVTGGMSWEIVGTGMYLTIGFTNPYAGSFKTWIGVLDRASPKYGYDHAQDEYVKLVTSNGFNLIARLEDSTIADRRMVFAISNDE